MKNYQVKSTVFTMPEAALIVGVSLFIAVVSLYPGCDKKSAPEPAPSPKREKVDRHPMAPVQSMPEQLVDDENL